MPKTYLNLKRKSKPKNKRKHYHPTFRPAFIDVEGLLVTKIFHHLTWKQYYVVRQQSGAPYYRTQIQHKQRELLHLFHSEPLVSVTGGYFPVELLIDKIYDLYVSKHAIGVHPFKQRAYLDFVLSMDGRRLAGNNEALHIRPVDVVNAQSSLHVHDFAIAAVTENNEAIHNIAAETDLNAFILGFEDHFADKYAVTANLLFSGDWMSIVADLGCPRPSTKRLADIICWGCGATHDYILTGWLDDPFSTTSVILDISDWPEAAFWGLPLYKRKYDWMHGVTNLLSNTIKATYELLPTTATGARGGYKVFMGDIHESWDTNSSLRAVEMKRFFRQGYHAKLSQYYDHDFFEF